MLLSQTPRGPLATRICLARNLLSVPLALLDDEVARVPFDHDLDLGLFMLRATAK